MKINNINELASAFGTTASHLAAILSNKARTDIIVDNSPTYVRIGTFVGDCNTELCIICKYPFELHAVTAFIDSVENTRYSMCECFDDPVEALMNMSNPGEAWSLEDATEFLSNAEANGWYFPDDITPQFILDTYNDMEPEEEDE